MEQAEKLCDHLCMINRGKKVIDGKLSDVKSQFSKDTIQIEIEGDGAFIRDLEGVKGVTEFNNYIELHIEDCSKANYLLSQVAEKVPVRRFEVVQPSLYQIFIDVAKIDPTELHSDAEVANV